MSDVEREVERFLFREARLADEHAYEEWESLWTDDALYWVPFGGDDIDPTKSMSVVYDNRSRISTRIRQFRTGKRHSAAPPPRIRRIVSNVELLGEEKGDLLVGANFVVYESRAEGLRIWAGRSEYRLRRSAGGGLEMAAKKVMLVDNDRPLTTLAFLI